MTDTQALADLSTRYVTARDNYAARYQARASGLIALSGGGPLAFADLTRGYAADMARAMPPMSVAQWEGLAELAAVQLNELRLKMSNG